MTDKTRAEACEEQLDALRGTMSEGQLALEALVLYRESGLQPPEWALAAIEVAYETFKTGAPPAGWVKAPKSEKVAPRTLGEAFGIEQREGNSHTNYNRGAAMPVIRAMFTGPNRLPRDDAGFELAAARLGIGVHQVRILVAELGE